MSALPLADQPGTERGAFGREAMTLREQADQIKTAALTSGRRLSAEVRRTVGAL